MKYCCTEFKEHVEYNIIEPPNGEEKTIHDDDDDVYWHVLWEWHTMMRLLYCPFCGSKLE